MCLNRTKMMTSYIWVQTADGSIQQVDQSIAIFCPFIRHEVRTGKGSSKIHTICLPDKVNPATLSQILDYCRFHQEPGHSNKERKSFDEKFMRMDTRRLCELASAADSLQFKPLVELTSRALARMIEGKTPEEIREIFCLPDDLTEEEKLEPVRNLPGDPRIRLLNRLYAKKKQELDKRNKMKTVQDEEIRVDDRSVDDLMLFINGGSNDCGTGKISKSKKKHRRRKEKKKGSPIIDPDESCKSFSSDGPLDSKNIHPGHSEGTYLQDAEETISYGSEDCEIDPLMKAIDREVEDFSRRLSLNWRERKQELLYGPGRTYNSHVSYDHYEQEQNRTEKQAVEPG